MKTKHILKLALSLLALTMIATGCQGKRFVYDASIKQSRVHCENYPNYDRDGGYPVSIQFDCDFGYNGSGEHPYLMVWLSGCSLRVNAADNSNWSSTRECLGDGISTVKLQLCQTHGGLLPDDCTGKRTWTYT